MDRALIAQAFSQYIDNIRHSTDDWDCHSVIRMEMVNDSIGILLLCQYVKLATSPEAVSEYMACFGAKRVCCLF